MKRKLLIVALALGTVGGFSAGFASLACRHRHHRHSLEQKVTDICTTAVKNARRAERHAD